MIQENTSTSRSTHTYAMVTTAFMAAVTCILAPLSIPIGPVPISLTNLAIYLSLSAKLETRHHQLLSLSADRTGRSSCLLWI